MFKPSRYQQNFFDELLTGKTDIQLVAVAGSGKTKSIQEASKRLPVDLREQTLMTAFNKHIQIELQNRQKKGDIPQGITISTIHGLGYKIVRDAVQPSDARNWLDEKKYQKITRAYWSNLNLSLADLQKEETKEAIRATEELSRLAMLTLTHEGDAHALALMAAHFGVDIPAGREETVFKGVAKVLEWGREGMPFVDKEGQTYRPSERISFDDMVYLPHALKLPVPHFKLCFIDECQDFNRAQQELLLRIRAGRAVWVGDPCQSIYGFTGADADAFRRIQTLTGAKSMPLSISYRCPRAVVELAREIVPTIEAADNAPEGVVVDVTEDQLTELAAGHFHAERARERREGRGYQPEPFLILCRVNAPLISKAFEFIGRGIAAKVKGRDIGTQLVKTIDTIALIEKDMGAHRPTEPFPFVEFPKACEIFRTIQEASLARRKNTEMQIAALHDRVDSILAVFTAAYREGARDVPALRTRVESLFSNDEQAVTLSSIHKAKGLEAKKVGILHYELLPHPMARQAWQIEQEHNLRYVAITRAQSELYISEQPRPGAAQKNEDQDDE